MTKYYFTIKPDADEVDGFFNDADHETIPDGAVETAKAEIDAACEAQAHDGKHICVTKGAIDLQAAPSRFHYWKAGKWVVRIEAGRAEKLSEITDAFSEVIKNGSFVSATLGIEVDCRRNSEKNDEQNVRGLISKMTRENMVKVEYRGKTDSATATLEQIQILQYEMEDHVNLLYAKKWALEKAVKAAVSAEELSNITWWGGGND